jgi:hypothetical protein
MWLQRIMYNVKNRLLSQTPDTSYPSVSSSGSPPLVASTKAQVIQHRLLELDRRLASLQTR